MFCNLINIDHLSPLLVGDHNSDFDEAIRGSNIIPVNTCTKCCTNNNSQQLILDYLSKFFLFILFAIHKSSVWMLNWVAKRDWTIVLFPFSFDPKSTKLPQTPTQNEPIPNSEPQDPNPKPQIHKNDPWAYVQNRHGYKPLYLNKK